MRRFAARIEAAVAAVLDEDRTTWWEARRRAARGETPDAAGPAVAQWRRVWEQTAPPDAPSGTRAGIPAWRGSPIEHAREERFSDDTGL